MLTLPEPNEFWPTYQERWANLLCGKTEGLQRWLDETGKALGQGQINVTDAAEARAALDNLHARLRRFESLKGHFHPEIDPRMVAHYVEYAGVIMGAPASRSAGAKRNVALRYGEVRGALEQLKALLAILELSPSVVLGLSDRDSQIIARALALRLKMRYDDASSVGVGQSEAIIVAADSRSINASNLTRIYPEQVLFAFNLHPLGANIAPDIAGLSRSKLVLPWHLEAEEAAAESEANEELPLREPSSIAAQIAATRTIHDASWPIRLEFCRQHGSLLAAGNPRLVRLPMLPGLPDTSSLDA